MWVLGEEATPIDERFFPILSQQWENLNEFLSVLLIKGTEVFLEFLGFSVNTGNRKISILDSSGIGIGNYCLGLEMMYLYLALVILTPGVSFLRKSFFVPIGLFVIQFANIVRMGLLAILVVKNPDWADFNHYFGFRVVVFLLILLMYKWMLSGMSKNVD